MTASAADWEVSSADGTRLACYELGGSGPVLLIAHATGLCAQMYARLASLFMQSFRVVAFDVRAHGNSSRPESGDLRWARVAEDVAAVRAALPGPVHGFGHSMGGAALLLAEAAAPGAFESLFLFEPIVFAAGMATDGQNFMAAAARRRRTTFSSRDQIVRRFAGRPPFSDIRAGILHDYVEYGFSDRPDATGPSDVVVVKCQPNDEAEFFEGGIAVKVAAVVGGRARTLVAVGAEEEGPNPARLGPPLAQAIAAKFVRFDNLGHFGPFQDPNTIARALVHHALGL
jgi:pimeloyl-ACP methyl ester carboxylesterase